VCSSDLAVWEQVCLRLVASKPIQIEPGARSLD
jgi:hypothetical protein